MPNSITIENPVSSAPPIQVPGPAPNFTLPLVSGTALVMDGTLTSISVRCCDAGSLISCAAPKAADTTLVGVFGGTSVYTWSARFVPVKNTGPYPGAENDAIATLVTSSGNKESNAVRFRAVGAVVFVAVAAEYVRLRRVYRVRFDAGTLPPLFNRLAGLGMNLSNRVKLFRAGDQWKSDDDSWTLEVDGTSAQISAQIEIAPGFTETQTWSCPDFHHRMGGVFAPQTPLISVNLLVS